MKTALGLMSSVFFWLPIALGLSQIVPYRGSLFLSGIFIATSVLSTVGALLLLNRSRREPIDRHPVMTIAGALIVVTTSGGIVFNQGGFPTDGIIGILWSIGLISLAPSSLVLFASVPINKRVRSVPLYLTSASSALAIGALIFVVWDLMNGAVGTNEGEGRFGLIALYWYSMPLVGLSYLASVVFNEKK